MKSIPDVMTEKDSGPLTQEEKQDANKQGLNKTLESSMVIFRSMREKLSSIHKVLQAPVAGALKKMEGHLAGIKKKLLDEGKDKKKKTSDGKNIDL